MEQALGMTGNRKAFTYTGEQLDTETSLVFLRARTYDPQVGRFLQRDPVLTANRYAYAGGNPLRYVDPTGHDIEDVPEEAGQWLGTALDFLSGMTEAGSDAMTFGATSLVRGDRSIARYSPEAYENGRNAMDLVMVAAGTRALLRGAAGTVVSRLTQAPRSAPLPISGASCDISKAVIDPVSGMASNIRVTPKGISRVEAHLGRPELEGAINLPENAAMLQRLRAALREGGTLSGADANFYIHELTEGTMVDSGMSIKNAHAAAFAKYGMDPRSVYHPDVIWQNIGVFNQSWLDFWSSQR